MALSCQFEELLFEANLVIIKCQAGRNVMQQIISKENCLLSLVAGIDLDHVDKHTIYPPGDSCPNCTVKTGESGVDGYGVIRLAHGLGLDERRVVIKTGEPINSGVKACIYKCRIPKSVEVKQELVTP